VLISIRDSFDALEEIDGRCLHFYFNIRWVESILGPLGTAVTPSLFVPAPGDCEDGEVGGMNGFGMGNRSTRRKPAPTPFCPP
jgi:hypothetical protein